MNAKIQKSDRLLTRSPRNPLITAADIPLPGGAACVFNSGATLHEGEIVMLVNLWDREWMPRFLVGRSRDGVHFEIDPRNRVEPPKEYPYVPHEGIFDTRITTLDGWHYITYNVGSRLGGRIMLARTRDFGVIETLGFITGPDHRNCVIFPEKINGFYARLERPNVGDSGDIYLSYSPDLIHWGQTRLVLEHNHRYWESAKIGPGAPPVKTAAGWLCIYHGCRQSMNGFSYQAGAMLLDLRDPSRIVGKCNDCLLAPEESYEMNGKCPNVVFPTAALRHGGEDELKVYYGAADSAMCLATARVSELVEACLTKGYQGGLRPRHMGRAAQA